MRSFKITILIFLLQMTSCSIEGQSFVELLQLCKKKYSSSDVVSGVIDVTVDKQAAISRSKKFLYADNRNEPWRLMILPEIQMDFFYISDSTYVFLHNSKSYYIDLDSMALPRFETYLDVISAILLSRSGSVENMDTTVQHQEQTVDKGNGVKEVTIISADVPEVGLSDFVFKVGFNIDSRTPLFANTSYKIMGDSIKEKILLDSVYSDPKESEFMLTKVRETIKSYTFVDFENIPSYPKQNFTFFDVAKGLEYVNQPPEISKYYLLDIYYTNCGPCMKAISHIKSVLKQSSYGTISVIAVSSLDAKEKIEKYNERNEINYSSAMVNPDFISKTIGEVVFPTFFLFDSEGKLVLESYGFNPEFFDKVIEIVAK